MQISYLQNKPDGLIAYQTLLYGTDGKEVVGNAFFFTDMAIYIMYDYSGNYMGEQIEMKE